MDNGARCCSGFYNNFAQVGTDWISHAYVSHHASSKEGASSMLGVIIELIGDDNVARFDLFPHAADRAHRDDPFNTKLFHAVNVRPVVDIHRHNTVSPAMTRKERYALTEESADHVVIGRYAEGSRDSHSLDVRKPFHLIQPAATDHADADLFRPSNPLCHP